MIAPYRPPLLRNPCQEAGRSGDVRQAIRYLRAPLFAALSMPYCAGTAAVKDFIVGTVEKNPKRVIKGTPILEARPHILKRLLTNASTRCSLYARLRYVDRRLYLWQKFN